LRVIRKYISPDRMLQSLSFFDVMKRLFKGKNRDSYLK